MVEEKTKYYLGVDWGLKMSGLAIVDGETKIASSKGECETQDLVGSLKEISNEIGAKDVVLGYSEIIGNDQQDKIKEIARELEKEGFIVHMEEEFFSTLLAQRNLKETGRKGISKNDNAESARIILQSWIDKKL